MSSLLEVYKDAKLIIRNPATLAKPAGVTVVAARDFLRDREDAQVRPRAVHLGRLTRRPTRVPRATISLNDYAEVNKLCTAIFTAMEVNSCYCYARSLTAPTSAQTAAALEDIFLKNADNKNVAPISKLRTDGRPEFAGACSDLLQKRGIPHEKTGATTGPRRRFNGLLNFLGT